MIGVTTGRALVRPIWSLPVVLRWVSVGATAEPYLPEPASLQPNAAEEGDASSDATGGAAIGVLRRWGCSEEEVARILVRYPAVSRMKPLSLQSKLEVLSRVGLAAPHLPRIVSIRPRFLAGRVGDGLDDRLKFLRTLFLSHEELLRAIVRNPSLLSYDVDRTMRPCTALYESVGVRPLEFGKVLLSRPTAISRSALDDEKRELIRRTGLPPDAATYKYAVGVFAVSHLGTIWEKIANFEKFGFSTDQVLRLCGRSPNVLTLSVEKVQRNMTYIVGTMKLSAKIVLEQPFLAFANLDMVLKPRFLLGGKLEEMNLQPQIRGENLIRALRMTEARFLKQFVYCHEKKVSLILNAYYSNVRGVRRLAEASRSATRKGFPF